MTDQQALDRYAANRDPDAFGALVEQYQRLVYSAVSRRLARMQDIEDVVQLTFLKLATHAGAIRGKLSAWLYVTAVNTANDLVRSDKARQRREASAARAETVIHDFAPGDWDKLSLLVDEAILQLPESEQSLIVEHLFRGRSQRDLAEELGVSQPTVQRQISAAVESLRQKLSGYDLCLTAPLLASALGKLTPASIPSAVTAELVKVGLSGVPGAPAAPVSLMAGSAWFTAGKIAIVIIAIVAAGVALLSHRPAPAGKLATAAPATLPAAAPDDWRAAFRAAYVLAPDQNLKYIPPPPLPERQRYLLETEHNDSPMPFIQWRWVGGRIKREAMEGSGPSGAGLGAVLDTCAGLDRYHASIDALPPIDADGDWIVRDGASPQGILNDLRQILHAQFKIDVNVQKIETTKDALIVTGRYHLKKIPGVTIGDLQVYTDVLDHPKLGDRVEGGGETSPAFFWTTLGGCLGIPIVDEATHEPREISWALSWSIQKADTPAGRQMVLDNITQQTGLVFKREAHNFITWKITPASGGTPATQAQ